MSVCDSFTEHAWIKGKCQDCFRPRDQHRGGPANQAAGGGHAAPANAEKTRPPVAKKPASFRAPAAPAQVGNGDGEVGRDARQAEGGRGAHAVTGWRKGADDGALDRKRSNNNNHHFGVRHARFECKEAAADFGSACDKLENGNNNDNDVFADAAVLANQQLAAGDAAGGCDNSSLALFLNRIRSRYHRSAERGAAAAHGCLASDRKVWRPRKRVRLGEGGPEVISHEGGVFCYADSEASSGSPEEAAGTGGVAAAREEGRESWDESDEELLAIEMRMRDRSRFAELRPNSLSPVHFGRHGGRAARPRNPVLRRDRPHGRDDRPEAERDAAGGADANPDPSEGKASYVSSSEDLETPSPVSAGALCPRQESTSQGLDSQGNTSVSSDDGNVADAEAELRDASERSDAEDAAESRRRQVPRKSTPSETDSESAAAEPGGAGPAGDKRTFRTRVSVSLGAVERNAKPCRVVNLDPAPVACDSGPGPDEVSAKPRQAEPMEGREQPHRPQQQQQPHRLQQQHMELRCGAQLDVAATRSAAAQEPLSTGEKRLNHAANLLFTLSAVPHTPVYAQSTRSKTFIPPSAAHEENNNNNYYVTPAPPTSESQASRPQRKDSPGERPGREHAQPHGRLGGGGNASPAIFAPNAASPRIGGPAVKTTTAAMPSGLCRGSPPKHKTFLYVEGAGGDPRNACRGSVTASERIERSEEGLLNANAAPHHAEDRGDASAALSQLVASIKPPNLPPELPKKRFKGRTAGDEAKLEVLPPPQYRDLKRDVSSDGRAAGSDGRHGASPGGFVDPDAADEKLRPPLLRQGGVVVPGLSAGRPPATPPRTSPKSRSETDGGADAPPRPPPRTSSSSGPRPEPSPLLPESSTSRTPSPGRATETGDVPGSPAPSPRQRQSVRRKSSHWEVVRNLFPWKKQQDGRPEKSGDRRDGAAPPRVDERPDPEQPSGGGGGGGVVVELDAGERPAAALLYKQDYPRFINPALGNGSGAAAQNSSRSPKSKKSSGSVGEEPEPRPRKRSAGAERGEKKSPALGVARQTAAKRPPAQVGAPIPTSESSVNPEDVRMDENSVAIAPSQPTMGNHARGDRPARRETPPTETETAPDTRGAPPPPSREASPRSPALWPPGGPLAAVYGNVGRLRAGMAPEKHPRPLREASEDAIAFEGPADADGGAATPELAPPPPLPAKRSGSRAGSSASASPSGFDAGPDASAPRDRRETKGEEGGHEAAGRVQQQQQQQGLSHTDPLGRRVPRKDRGGGAQRGPRQQQLFKSHSVECSPVHAAFSGDATPERRASPASRGQRPPRSLESTSQDSIPESDDSLADGDGSPFPAPALDAAHAGRGPRQRPGSKPGSADGGGEAVAPAGSVYRNIESAEAVSARILSLQAEATRRLAAKCEQVFMRGCAARVGLREESWPDFKLRSNKPCCEAGDGTYYAATYAKDPDHAYAIKVCKGRADASQRRRQQQSATVTRGVPVHYNIQQECGHFVAEVPPSLLPHGEDADGADPGRLVVIAREAPHRTLADLVRTSAEEHRAEPERYERLASLLLLQLCAALEHLKVHGVTHCGLRLENLLLARSGRPGDPTPRLVLSNFLQAKQQQQQPKNRARHDRGETGAGPPGGPAPPEQLRLAPELLSAAQYRKLDEFQTGILIYEMLHLPNPFEDDPGLRASGYSTDDLPPFLRLSCYSSGLQRLAFQLLQPDPASRLPIAEARVALQLLAWGPQAEHLTRELGGPRPDGRRLREVLRNWLDVRRALLMVVFAEKALAQDGPEGGGVNLEDWLRCQFFAFTTVDCMARAVELLRLC
ncbi:LOW QUALITY PROTEIN: uncharacterized protein LOC144722114 [Lampetra planeri]